MQNSWNSESPIASTFHPPSDIDKLNETIGSHDTEQILDFVLHNSMFGKIALVSSFGTDSATLLHQVAQIDPGCLVLFVDTGKHFSETLEYRDRLVETIGLTNVLNVQPDADHLRVTDPKGLRWSYDPDHCCQIRKVTPLDKVLANYDSVITGRKAFQSSTRSNLRVFEIVSDQVKINPLAGWTKEKIVAYLDQHQLPRHPLEKEGYLSIGCAPCTSKVLPGEDIRAGRWRNHGKVECGIHSEASLWSAKHKNTDT